MAMKVLHVVQSLDPAWGGIAHALAELAAGLAQRGVDCRIATLAGGRYGHPPPIDRVRVLTFSAPDRSALGWSRDFARQAADLVADADVVHLHGLWTGQNWSAGAAARRAGKPCVITPHSMMMPWAWRRSWWKKRPIGWLFEHRNLRAAARLHALAEGEAQHMRTLAFNPRIEVLPNGVWPQEFAQLPEPTDLIAAHPELDARRWLLFLSRIHVQKGIVPLLQACLDLAGSLDDWQLVIAGPDWGGLQRVLTAAVARKGLSDRVTFLGMLDRPRVLQALGRAAIFVQPSLSEGLSVSILEALAAGVPVLISEACNLPEVRDSDAGRVVPPERRPIAAALRELLGAGPDALTAMGRRGRQLIADRFDWAVLLPRYIHMYEKIRSERPARV